MSTPRAIRWLFDVLSERGPERSLTKLTLAGMFPRMNWDTGGQYFESCRRLAARVGLSKDTVRKHLELATSAGWLARKHRGRRGDLTRTGFEYMATWPPVLSEALGQEGAGLSQAVGLNDDQLCPNRRAVLSEMTGRSVLTVRTDSLLLPNDSQKALRARESPGTKTRKRLREALASAARRSHERAAFEIEYPEALEPLRRIGGWQRLGQSNEHAELPRLIAQVVDAVRAAP